MNNDCATSDLKALSFVVNVYLYKGQGDKHCKAYNISILVMII